MNALEIICLRFRRGVHADSRPVHRRALLIHQTIWALLAVLVEHEAFAAPGARLEATVTTARQTSQYAVHRPDGTIIGAYVVTIQPIFANQRPAFRLTGRFDFKIPSLLREYRYQSTDIVIYDELGTRSYEINESAQGVSTTVKGTLSEDGSIFTVQESDDGGHVRQSRAVRRTDYDFTLFALRFPKPCTEKDVGGTAETRLLIPRTGAITRVVSRVEEMVTIPTTQGEQRVCRVVSKDDAGKGIRESFVNARGDMVEERSTDYLLRLVSISVK